MFTNIFLSPLDCLVLFASLEGKGKKGLEERKKKGKSK